jgi:hypothetical protein
VFRQCLYSEYRFSSERPFMSVHLYKPWTSVHVCRYSSPLPRYHSLAVVGCSGCARSGPSRSVSCSSGAVPRYYTVTQCRFVS